MKIVLSILCCIVFCSCREQTYEEKMEGIYKADSIKHSKDFPSGQPYVKPPIEERKDAIVRQDVTYENGKYYLRTIVPTGLRYLGYKETAEFRFFLNDMNIKVVYDNSISGNFNYIKNDKPKQFKKAEKYMWEYYRIKGIKDKKAKLINDSIELLNTIK